MKEHFYVKGDQTHMGKLTKLKPETTASFRAFQQQVFEEGALSTKMKELIAIGVTHVTRCPYCIDAHVKAAKKAGASDEEIAEAIYVGVALSAGAAFAHSRIAMDNLSE